MAERFHRFSRQMKRFASLDYLDQRMTPSSPTATEDGKLRAYTTPDNIDCGPPRRRLAWQEIENDQDRCNALNKQWMEEWQIPLVVPFGQKEFKHRVEAVKSALSVEMDRESARDLRKYNLAGRRIATCKEMISPQLEKAACKLGILGF